MCECLVSHSYGDLVMLENEDQALETIFGKAKHLSDRLTVMISKRISEERMEGKMRLLWLAMTKLLKDLRRSYLVALHWKRCVMKQQ